MNKETFFAWAEAPLEIEVPDLGKVWVRQWSALEREEFAIFVEKNKSKLSEIYARCIVLSCLDENKSPLFSKEDIPKLQRMPGKVMDFLFEQCVAHQKLNAGAIEDTKDF